MPGRACQAALVPKWTPDKSVSAPDWLREGARVHHTTFGSGTVGRVGEYKEVPSVWIDFDSGDTKALALEFGLAHLTPG
jgi:transcription elongation factor GreA-like protein